MSVWKGDGNSKETVRAKKEAKNPPFPCEGWTCFPSCFPTIVAHMLKSGKTVDAVEDNGYFLAITSHAGGILMTSRLADENKRAESISPRAHCAASRLAGRSTWPSNFFRQFLSLLDVQVVLRG